MLEPDNEYSLNKVRGAIFMTKIHSHVVSRSLLNITTDSSYCEDRGNLLGKNAKPLVNPAVIFIPSKRIMRQMIEANMEHSQRDSLEKFLLRFGVVTNPIWYLQNT